jgi:hypothetical protein
MVQTILVKRRAGSGAPGAGTFGELSYSATDNVFRVYDGSAWQGFASLASPAFTGTPTAPTAVAGTNTTQVATTAFVQEAVGDSIEGIDWKASVALTTDANANWTGAATADYVTGTGVLTLSALTAGASLGLIDAAEPVATDRILIKDAATISALTTDGGAEATPGKYNGIWEVTGGTTTTLTLTRTDDADASAKVTNGMTIAGTNAGAVNVGGRYILITQDPIVLNTTALVFSKLSTTNLTAGDGIDITAGVIDVDVTDLVGTGIEDDGSNNFRLAAAGFGNGLTGGGGTAVSIQADSTTGVTVAPLSVTGNGAGVTVDNTSIVHTTGTISVATVDGGTY